jgi:uncharacterized protein
MHSSINVIAAVGLAFGGAGLLMLVSLPGAVRAGPLEDAEAATRRDDFATAIPIYRSLAEKGDVSAQKRLGFFYQNGVGVKRDWVESAKR